MNCGRGGAVGEPNAVFYHGRYARRFAGGATSLSMTVLSHNRIHVRGVITFDNGMVDPSRCDCVRERHAFHGQRPVRQENRLPVHGYSPLAGKIDPSDVRNVSCGGVNEARASEP